MAVSGRADRWIKRTTIGCVGLLALAAFTDPALERDCVYCRALSSYLRGTDTVERLDLSAEVELTHLRQQMTFTGSLALTADVGEVRSFFGEGKGTQQELDLEHSLASSKCSTTGSAPT